MKNVTALHLYIKRAEKQYYFSELEVEIFFLAEWGREILQTLSHELLSND